MIIAIDDRRGSKWPLFIGLAVLSALAILGAGSMQQRALDAKIASQELKAAALARQAVAPATKGLTLTKPFGHAVAARLDRSLEKGVLAAGVVLRVRIFAQDGTLLFSTDPGDRAKTARVGDPDAIRAASVGATSSVVGTDRVTTGGGKAVPVQLLQSYVQLSGAEGTPVGAVGVDQRYQPLEVASKQPWHTVQYGLAAAAALFLLIGLMQLSRRVSVKRAKAKAKAPAAPKPATKEPDAAPEDAPEERRSFRKGKSAASPAVEAADDAARVQKEAHVLKEAQREVQVREALEGQLEQLRTRIREGEAAANRQVLELTQQLQVAASRVEAAEARAAAPGGVDAERLAAAEQQAHDAAQRAEQIQARALAAEARVGDLEAHLADAQHASVPPPTDERIAELERALNDATTASMDNARRAEATEAVRDELEIKVAQFGSRAQDQEATARALADQLREVEAVKADLERRAHEAESGGDAVRSEVAQLTAERDSLRTRVSELEQTTAIDPQPHTPDIEAVEQLASARTELRDLRQQLGLAIERARVAEERGAKLEADLLAERQGVRELDEAPAVEPRREEPDQDEPMNPFPWLNENENGNGNGNGAAPTEDVEPADEADPAEDPEPQGDRSLRYRLAQSAARKKGLGDIELPS
jgi:hypothetical protein